MNDICVYEGRIGRCKVRGITGHELCPGDCPHALRGYQVQIRHSELINRGLSISRANGWTRGDAI